MRWWLCHPVLNDARWSTDDQYERLSFEEWIARTKEMQDAERLLQGILVSDSNGAYRARSAMALGLIGSHDSAALLIKALESDDDTRVQWNAAAALGDLGVIQAIDPLCSATKSKDKNVRANACGALGRLGGDRAVQCLREVLKQEPANGFVAHCAAEALKMAADRKPQEKQSQR
jgi:HEAT repeat protein